jgi:hypothetical protein
MRLQNLKRSLLVLAVLFATPMLLTAQEAAQAEPSVTKNMIKEYLSYYDSIQNFRYYDVRGVNVFETPKNNVSFNGLRVRFGAGFTQQFQNLKHENYLTGVSLANTPVNEVNNRLYPLSAGLPFCPTPQRSVGKRWLYPV